MNSSTGPESRRSSIQRFGNRWYHHDGVPELTGEEFCDDEPSDPSGMEFSDEPNPSEW